eukprot:SAG31_NODE_19075_length_612_cov_6.475634_2_plen_45_part_01
MVTGPFKTVSLSDLRACNASATLLAFKRLVASPNCVRFRCGRGAQ